MAVVIFLAVVVFALLYGAMAWLRIQALVNLQRSMWRDYNTPQRLLVAAILAACIVVLIASFVFHPFKNVTVPPR